MKRAALVESGKLGALQRRWALTLLTFAGFLWAMNALLASDWSASLRWGWTLAAGAFCVYVLIVLWKALPYNYRLEDGYFFPYFGAGNLMSLLRAWFLAALAGFLVAPIPKDWLAWLPGVLYILNGLADLFDGYLARRARQVTAMGERLDMSLDGLGVLFASLLLYRYGTLPAWILLVGAARFLFLAVAKLRQWLAKPVYDLPPSSLRRALAGAQMGFLGGALLPVFTPPATVWAGTFFSLPFLVHFGRDVLWMCGVISEAKPLANGLSPLNRLIALGRGWLFEWLPLGVRLGAAGVLLVQGGQWFHSLPPFLVAQTPLGTSQTQFQLILAFYALGFVSATLGLVGRGGAASLLIGVGLQQGILPLGWQGVTLLFSAALLFFLGSGRASLWKPEERWIRQRWGGKVK